LAFHRQRRREMTTLTQANREWETRKADERYSSIEAMHTIALIDRERAKEAAITSPIDLTMTTEVDREGVAYPVLMGRGGRMAKMTNWAFGQLAQMAKAPASYLRTLPARIGVDALAHGLQEEARRRRVENEDRPSRLLFNDVDEDNITLRAIHSDRYARIWNADITERLAELKARGPWQEAPAAFDGSRGQYLSDRDMFSFFVDSERRIFETAPGGGLSRGFFAWNSEVGARTFGVMTFLYEYVCGNHRVWGAQNLRELRIRHVGDASAESFRELEATLREYANASADEDEGKIVAAREYKLGEDKDEVLDVVFGLNLGPSRRLLADAFDKAQAHDEWYGDPKSAWGFAGGLTQLARDLANADERDALDRAAYKVMEEAW
jgi:hypothetical protein